MRHKLCFFMSVFFLFLIGCSSPKITQIGKINMISNRNVDSDFNYVSLGSYIGYTKKELKKIKTQTIDEAVDNTVRSVPGGDFLMNAKIYSIEGKYFAVEGDVWGKKTREFKGFEVGNTVEWKSISGSKKGTVTGFANEEELMVKETGSSTSVKVNIVKLTKVEN